MSRMMCSMMKGLGVGLAVGMTVGVTGTLAMQNNRCLRKSGRKAVHAVEELIGNVSDMMH